METRKQNICKFLRNNSIILALPRLETFMSKLLPEFFAVGSFVKHTDDIWKQMWLTREA